MNFYNDNEPFAAEWIQNLINEGAIPNGFVDSRSVEQVQAADLVGYRQCHFFCGIAGWPEAFRIAGIAGAPGVWSASLPCQPVSSAGKHGGENDERHLWPEFYPLISECRPTAIFGEQSASKDGREWLDGISLDLEEMGYVVAASDLPAAGVSAPHRRQRMFWAAFFLADSSGSEFTRWCQSEREHRSSLHASNCGRTDGLGNATRNNEQGVEQSGTRSTEGIQAGRSGAGMDDANFEGLEGHAGTGDGQDQRGRVDAEPERSVTAPGPWDDFRIVTCADGKKRRVGTGVRALAYGIPRKLVHLQPEVRELATGARRNRIGRLKGYGNAIVPQVAAVFVQAAIETFLKTFDPTH